jgi:signal transduction histidine kinase
VAVPLLSGCSSTASGGGGGSVAWGLALGLVAVSAVAALVWLVWQAGQRTARAEAAERAAAQARQLKALLRLGGGPVFETDPSLQVLRITVADPATAAGLDTAAWPGRRLTALWLDDDGATGPTLTELLALRAHLHPRPVRLAQPTGDGAPPLELLATPLSDAQGEFSGYLGVVRERRETSANSSPADADDALSFSYTVSHDLRAPVRVVDGFARILKEDYGSQLDRVGNDHLDRVLSAAARMNQMIDALLAMARLSSQPLQRQPVNLSQLAGFVVDELRRGDPQRSIRFEIEPGLVAQGDPTLLRQLLENLLGNAWKYTQRTSEPVVAFRREYVDGRASYAVQDNGTGFDMRSVERLFGLFQRLHSASEFPGTGVGLASVKRIVARHGGRIWAESEPGRGATFHFTLKD